MTDRPNTCANCGKTYGEHLLHDGNKCSLGSVMGWFPKTLADAMTDLLVLSGDDSLTLPILAVGGSGVVSVVGNIVPKDMIALISAYQAGNTAEALAWHRKLFPLCRDMLGLSTNPIPIKAAMKLLGRDTGEMRLPMTPLSPADEAKLRGTLVKYGLEVRG